MRRVLALESLESRRVLTWGGGGGFADVSLGDDGVLSVVGSHRNDRVWVYVGGDLDDQVVVRVGQTTHEFNLADVLSVSVSGGKGNDHLHVDEALHVHALIYGGRGNDWLWGGGGDDHLVGGDGNDRMFGRCGDDLLEDHKGNNAFWGGSGNDEMHGGRGHDRMHGGDGDDVLWGGSDHDRLFGEAGNDMLYGEGGKDHLSGGEGDDAVYGGDDKDHLYGGDGHDELYGQAGKDHVHGGEGNDWVEGGGHNDKLFGDGGDDSLKGGLGNDYLNGGLGVNLLDGDEGRNKLVNGTPHDFDAPPDDPEDPPAPVEYVTMLDDGVYSATLIYTDNGTEQVLTLRVNGPVDDFVVFMLDGQVWDMFTIDSSGEYTARYSSLHDDPGELPFASTPVDGAEVSIGTLLGPLNLSFSTES
jgi:Ca2+-binding RTX toxin-like protein